MKSHRKHKPLLPSERETNLRKGRITGRVSPDGVKKRLDKLKAAELDFWFWFNSMESGKASAAKCPYRHQGHAVYSANGRVLGHCYHGDRDGTLLKRAKERYERLWKQASIDGIV